MNTPEPLHRYNGILGDCPALRAVVGYYPNHYTATAEPVEIGWYLTERAEEERSKTQAFRDITTRAATTTDPEERDRLNEERKRLKAAAPCITPHGFWEGRRTENSSRTPSNLLCIDIDRKDNEQVAPEEWEQLPQLLATSTIWRHVVYIGESRSGRTYGGYFLLLLLSGADDWKKRFAAVKRWFDLVGINIDTAAANITHCRAISLQGEGLPLVNLQPVPLNAKHDPNPPKRSRQANHLSRSMTDEHKRLQAAANYCTAHGISICEAFTDWTACAMALAADFGEQGRALFHQFASLSIHYREGENDYKFNNALRTASRVHIATIWEMLKAQGINPKDFNV